MKWKNDNNGFTLVELLGVIIILSVIALIIYPIFNESINSSKEKLYQEQITSLEKNARRWGVDNSNYLINTGSKCSISFSNLITGGYIADADVVNPKNDQPLTGCISVYWNDTNNQYVYNYNETCTESGIAITACH
jgi:prepilin-type N-terminal cleavage/methylation domain-containing protein